MELLKAWSHDVHWRAESRALSSYQDGSVLSLLC